VASRLFCPEALLITRSEMRRAIGILIQYFIVSVRFLAAFGGVGILAKTRRHFALRHSATRERYDEAV
jgi:hypothetical protein